MTQCCPPAGGVLELRQYALHPGTRETLIDVFDREFVESQEALGITVVAQFRDLDRPDVFTWMRSFPDMPSRAASLGAFYGGPAWAQHCDTANATMVAFDNVRLLRRAFPSSGIEVSDARAPVGFDAVPAGLVVVNIYTLTHAAADGFRDWFVAHASPRLAANGAPPIAMLETDPSPNTFPRLPVREGEHSFVWVARFDNAAAHARHLAALAADSRWRDEIAPVLDGHLAAPSETWRLTPTARARALVD